MTTWGMDDDEARRLGLRMQEGSARVQELAHRLHDELAATPWTGADRDRFEDRWSRSVGPVLLSIADHLAESGRHLAAQADRQTHASR